VRIRYTFLLSAKYLYGHFRRYVFLLAALVFGFAVITVMTSLEEGMSQSVYRAAENHYAGHLFVLGFEKTGGGHIVVEKDREIREAVREAGLNPAKIVRRTNYFSKGVLYFNGIAVRQKYVYGVDWKNERENFDRLNYSSGGPANLEGKNWIIISSAVSDRLHARMGDEIILEVLTRTGQKNTGVFVVKGIVEDTSIFGYYKCFVDRRRLNSLLRYKEDEYSSLGLYFESLNGLWEKNERLYSALEKRITMGPRIHDKEDLTYQMDSHWEDNPAA
jgi:putative ABC transport system permease protein